MEEEKILKSIKCDDVIFVDPRTLRVRENYNCRENFDLDELVESIKENGILNDITVTKKVKDGKTFYLIVDGERRYRACMRAIEEGADITRIRAQVIPDMDESELLIQQVVRNQGKPFNEYEYGHLCYKLKQRGMSLSEIGKRLGKNAGHISYMLQTLEYPERLRELVKMDKITGAEVRRLKTIFNGDMNMVENEVVEAYEKQKAENGTPKKNSGNIKPKSRITLGDLSARTKSAKDSKVVLKGLETLDKYLHDVGRGLDTELRNIMEELRGGGNIREVLSCRFAESA